MTNATTFEQLNETLQAEPLCNASMIERIDSSKPLAVVTGIAASSLAFTSAFGLGIFTEKMLLSQVMSAAPIQPVAIACTAVSAVFMVLTMKAGLQNNVTRALAYGSAGAYVLGVLGAAVGI